MWWLRDRWDDLVDGFTYEPKKYWTITGVVVAIVVALFLMINYVPTGVDDMGDPVPNSNLQVTQMKSDSKKLQKKYDLLSKISVNPSSMNKNGLLITADLYMKHPFESEDDVNADMNTFVKTLKAKYANKKKVYILGVKVRLYDRMIVYDKGLTPRGTYYYEPDSTDYLQQLTKQAKSAGKGGIFGSSNGDDAATSTAASGAASDLSVGNIKNSVWLQLNAAKTKYPDYAKYVGSVDGFNEYTLPEGEKPLTDQEFAFYLKLMLYKKITDDPTTTYVTWDLGLNATDTTGGNIRDDLTAFMKREQDIGDSYDYYSDSSTLYGLLAVERPQFLLYGWTETVDLSRASAQKELIKQDSDDVAGPIKQDIKARSNAIQQSGKSTYKPGTDFDATVGVLKKGTSTPNGLTQRQITDSTSANSTDSGDN